MAKASASLGVVTKSPGATRKKRWRIAVARYLPRAMPPAALRISGSSASQFTWLGLGLGLG